MRVCSGFQTRMSLPALPVAPKRRRVRVSDDHHARPAPSPSTHSSVMLNAVRDLRLLLTV
jgi:hypothetical protein